MRKFTVTPFFVPFQNDVIWDTVDEFPFYKLPLIKQKLIVLSLGRVQNSQKITIGPFSELNYEMSTKVMIQLNKSNSHLNTFDIYFLYIFSVDENDLFVSDVHE